MKNKIEFDTSAGKHPVLADSSTPQFPTSGFRSLIFRDEMYKRKKRLDPKTDPYWLRFLPPIKGSTNLWMMKLDVYSDMNGVTFVSPTTFDERAEDPIRTASKWFRENAPEELRKKDVNPDGFKLWATPYGVAWVIDENAPEGERLGLYLASLYDGSRGGTQGAAFRIKSLAEEIDNEPGSSTKGEFIHGDISDPETGKLVKLQVSKNGDYNSYQVGIGKAAAPICPLFEKLTEQEQQMIAPLETVIYVPTTEEIHEILKGYIGEDFYKKIFA